VDPTVDETEQLAGWAELYRNEGPRLWRALIAYSASRDVADDALNEAFTQAITRGRAVRSPSSWVWTVAFKVAAGELKRRHEASCLVDAGQSYDMPQPAIDLIEALRMLSPSQRAVVVLHDYADRPTKEIGHTLGMRVATVHVHLSQGRKRLRERLGVADE
jgi:RNA polymerase sigma-70 factor (ECF subfamily)